MSTALNTIGPTLRKARIDANLNQIDIAEALGISLWTYNRLENGKRTFESHWVSLLPEKVRRPVVQLLTQRAQQNLNYLRSLGHTNSHLEVA
jgi:DNA-binding XRE family transcriptional regulator